MMSAACVEVEESQLGEERWAVIIWRGHERSLWNRYTTQKDAERGKQLAQEYLASRGEGG